MRVYDKGRETIATDLFRAAKLHERLRITNGPLTSLAKQDLRDKTQHHEEGQGKHGSWGESGGKI